MTYSFRHSVVTTVRSASKTESIKKDYPQHGKETLDFVFVKDIAVEGAFDEAVQSDPPFEAVVSSDTYCSMNQRAITDKDRSTQHHLILSQSQTFRKNSWILL
jgi:hypothetical protein